MANLRFSKITIIESLPPGEKKTGRLIADDVQMLSVFHEFNVDVEYKEVISRIEFLQCLVKLQEEAKAGIWPILHIECHGMHGGVGIVLANGDHVSWADVKPYLTELNVATQCNLLVVLVACYGAHMGQLIQVVDRAPFWAMVSPTNEIYPQEIMETLTAFYKGLISEQNGDVALEAILSIPLRNGGYYFASAAGFFKRVYASYIKEESSKEAIELRAKRMHKNIKKSPSLVRVSKGRLKRLLKSTESQYYQKHYRNFFMVDLYPENSQRFTVSLNEVKRLANEL